MSDKKISIVTSNLPLLLTQGKEANTIITRIMYRNTPVGLAAPCIKPKQCGLAVNIHSA